MGAMTVPYEEVTWMPDAKYGDESAVRLLSLKMCLRQLKACTLAQGSTAGGWGAEGPPPERAEGPPPERAEVPLPHEVGTRLGR